VGKLYRFGLQETGVNTGEFKMVLKLSKDEFDIPLRVEFEGVSDSTIVSSSKAETVPYGSESFCGYGTVFQDGICVVEESLEYDSGGGCLIATATFGSELAPQVQQLRELRDNYLLKTESGTSFMNSFNEFYYSFSPYIADYERENPVFKEVVKIAITPLISSLSILNYVDMDSEVKVLGYGISLILLNLGMYFIAPALLVFSLKKFGKTKSLRQI